MRTSWLDQETRCDGLQGTATFLYGSEYMGDFQPLVLTPEIERQVTALTAATYMHAVPCTSGAVSTGKTGIIKVALIAGCAMLRLRALCKTRLGNWQRDHKLQAKAVSSDQKDAQMQAGI